MSKKQGYIHYIGLLASMLFWAFSFIWTKQAYESFTPLSLIYFRLFISLVILWVFGLIFGRITPLKKRSLKYLLLLAFLEPFIYFLGENYGLLLVSPTTGAVIISTAPLFVSIASFIFLKEPFPIRNFLSALISFSGVLLIIFSKQVNIGGQLLGVLLIFIAVLSIVGYALVINKIADKYNPLSIITYQNTLGFLFFTPLFFFLEFPKFSFTEITHNSYIKLLLLAVFASSFAYVFFIDSMRKIGIRQANYFVNLIPMFTAIFAIYEGLDNLTLRMFAGIFLTIIGLFLSQIKRGFITKLTKNLLKSPIKKY